MSEAASHSSAPAAAAPHGRGAVARNAFHLVLGQVAVTALSVVFSGALGRWLGAADFGLFYLVWSMTSFAYAFAEWGQGSYVVREVARNPERSSALLGASLASRAGGAAVVLAAASLVAWLLGYDHRTRQLAALLIAANLPMSLSQGYCNLFRAHERMDYDAAVSVLAKLLTVGFTLPALALGGRLPAVIGALGLAGAGAMAASALVLRRLRLPPLEARWATVREVVAGGTPFVAMGLTIQLQPYLDAVVLSKLAAPSTVGWYGAAKNFMNALVMPASILASASYPRLSRASLDPAEFAREVRANLRPVLVMGAYGAVGTFLFAGLVVDLVYGRAKFEPSVVVLQVFAPGLLLFFMDMLLVSSLVAAGKAKPMAVAKLAAVVVSTALSAAMVPFFEARMGNGGVGVVLGFALAEVVMLAASIRMAPRGMLGAGLFLDLGRSILAAGGTLLLLRPVWGASPVLLLPGCTLVFAGLAAAVGLLRRSDLAVFQEMLRRRP